jgi:hypothetical protein
MDRPPPTSTETETIAQPADFVNLDDMTTVRASSSTIGWSPRRSTRGGQRPAGGVYPVGTIIQLVPQEAMVKRAAGSIRRPTTGSSSASM